MFKINKYRSISSDFPKIIAHYDEFHFDEFPILYVGQNKYGNIIIGSLMCEDEASEKGGLRFIHTIISANELWEFIMQKIPYRALLKDADYVYVLDKDYNNHIKNSYYLPIKEIDKSYLPLEDTYCPPIREDQIQNLLAMGVPNVKIQDELNEIDKELEKWIAIFAPTNEQKLSINPTKKKLYSSKNSNKKYDLNNISQLLLRRKQQIEILTHTIETLMKPLSLQ